MSPDVKDPEKKEKTAKERSRTYHKSTFDKIDEEKRARILDAALAEFSSRGFNAANINTIAKNAGISIGSMYTYFHSKEDLFLTVLDSGYAVIEESLRQIDLMNGSIFDKLEQILCYVQKYSRQYSLLNQAYLEATTQGIAHLSKKLSLKMETVSSQYYKAVLRAAQAEGVVDPDIDVEVASFCLDNIILLLQFSYSAEYYRERMKIFAGEHSPEQDERMGREIMYLLKKALSPPA
jgi:AcrR family transcriptional regulator